MIIATVIMGLAFIALFVGMFFLTHSQDHKGGHVVHLIETLDALENYGR